MQVLSGFAERWRPESFFLVAGGFFGLLVLIILPLMQAPDEQSHFYRAYQLADLQLKSDQFTNGSGGNLPAALQSTVMVLMGTSSGQPIAGHPAQQFSLETLNGLKDVHVDSRTLAPTHFEGAALYSPVAYIPQVTAVWLGKAANLPVVWLMYLVRFVNLAAWLLLIYAAIRLTPVGKWALVLFALLPATVAQTGSMSADVMTNGLAFILIALFMRLIASTKPIDRPTLGLIGVVAVSLALCKTGFAPLALLFLLVPVARFGSRKVYLIFNGAVLGAAVLAALLWARFVQDLVPYMAKAFRPGDPIDMAAQLHGLVAHPTLLPKVLANTFVSNLSDPLYRQFIGILGWLDAPMPLWAVLVGFAVLGSGLYVIAKQGKAPLLNSWRRLAVAGLAIVIAIIVAVLLYLTVTPVGQTYIDGLQGRYFLPAVLLLVPLFAAWPLHKKLQAQGVVVAGALGSIGLLVTMLVTLVYRYYA